MAIVQYLSVEAIRSKLKHFHSYMISRHGLYKCTNVLLDLEDLEDHTNVINFNSYNQLYNMKYSKV